MNYLLPGLSILMQLYCVTLYYKAYKADGKKNVLASLVTALFAIFSTALAPFLDARKAEATLAKQAQVMQAAIVQGTNSLKRSNQKLQRSTQDVLAAQEATRKALEELKSTQREVEMLRTIITSNNINSNVATVNHGVQAQRVNMRDNNSFSNSGRVSTSGGSIMIGGTGNRQTIIGEQPPIKSYVDRVGGFIRSAVQVEKGQRVRIIAAGSINVGPVVGSSGPEGRSSGVFGFGLSQYNIVPTCNHAALLYRIEGEGEWEPCGLTRTFTAARSGHLEFQVNDNQQRDNSGAYQVTTQVFAD